MANEVFEKALVRKYKGEIIVFWPEMKANYGKICSNGIISDTMIDSGSEASIGFYLKTKKATDNEVKMAQKAIKFCYDIDFEPRCKLTQKDISFMWNHKYLNKFKVSVA